MSESMAPALFREQESRCCTVCGQQTNWACSDCQIDFQTMIYVCDQPKCRNSHEEKCSAQIRGRLASVVEALREMYDHILQRGLLHSSRTLMRKTEAILQQFPPKEPSHE